MKRHILIIDDEPYFRHVAAFMLRNAGYTVSSASTTEQAFTLLFNAHAMQRPYDLLFVDTHLPAMNTQQLADALRARKLNIPMLTVGGFTDKSFVLEMLNSGHHEFLENIFAATDMNKTIEETFKMKSTDVPKKMASPKKPQKTAQRSTNK
jgi:DNA-binding NtrC family response regulator